MTRSSTRLIAAASISGVLLALAAGTASAATPTTSTTKAAGCPSGPVATALVGNPDVKSQQAEGFYVFHDSKGYEVEVTHPGKAKTIFAGTLTASKGFAKLDKVRLENGDYATESANHKTIAFRFTNFGGIDGFHAYGDCSAAVTVSLRINGKTASTKQVFLGKAKSNPTSVPFTIDRSKSVAGVATAA